MATFSGFMVMAALTFGLLFMLSHNGLRPEKISMVFKSEPSPVYVQNNSFSIWGRRLLNSDTSESTQIRINCSTHDIKISQAVVPSPPSGIPTFLVEITNICRSGCAIRDIRLYCSGFTSANLIDPLKFRHLPSPNRDYCIINSGKPLRAGAVISFTYTDSFMYKQFFVSSVACP